MYSNQYFYLDSASVRRQFFLHFQTDASQQPSIGSTASLVLGRVFGLSRFNGHVTDDITWRQKSTSWLQYL